MCSGKGRSSLAVVYDSNLSLDCATNFCLAAPTFDHSFSVISFVERLHTYTTQRPFYGFTNVLATIMFGSEDSEPSDSTSYVISSLI